MKFSRTSAIKDSLTPERVNIECPVCLKNFEASKNWKDMKETIEVLCPINKCKIIFEDGGFLPVEVKDKAA